MIVYLFRSKREATIHLVVRVSMNPRRVCIISLFLWCAPFVYIKDIQSVDIRVSLFILNTRYFIDMEFTLKLRETIFKIFIWGGISLDIRSEI